MQSLPKAAGAEQITEALRRSGVLGEGRVADVAVEKSFPTVLSYIFRLRLTYEGAHDGAPASLMLKTGLVGGPGGDWVGGRSEVAFYTKVASAMPEGSLLRCFDAHWDDDTRDWHLLLEDVTDSHFVATTWPLPPTVEQCESIVRAMARFHTAWWDDPRLGKTVGQLPDAASAEQFRQRLAGNFVAFADSLGGNLSAERRDQYARLIEQLPRLAARRRSHWTIVHGDAHVWNCFLPRTPEAGGTRLFDWDAWRLGACTADLGYTMAMHWYPDLRQRIEAGLLDTYHDELMANGVHGYDRRALQDDYRMSVLWLSLLPIWQHAAKIPPVIWWNNLERIHLAIDDLGCRELLD
jgi:hypothetical protein